MSTNLAVVSPDFDDIREEAGLTTSNAIKLLWEVLNFEILQRRKGINRAINTLQGKITSDTSTANENNLDTLDSLVWWYNTASNINVTGFRNGVAGRVIIVHNVGSGTITFKHNVTSDTANQLVLATGADTAVATGASIIFLYINAKWRELNLV